MKANATYTLNKLSNGHTIEFVTGAGEGEVRINLYDGQGKSLGFAAETAAELLNMARALAPKSAGKGGKAKKSGETATTVTKKAA